MKNAYPMLFLFAFTLGAAPAIAANPDGLADIKQCIKDNEKAGQTPTVLKLYCECMNMSMPYAEKGTITEWEKKNPKARDDCRSNRGWRQ
jgi:hypothetical protein